MSATAELGALAPAPRFLLAAVRLWLSPNAQGELQRVAPQVDWDDCTRLARAHSLLPLAFHNLQSAGLLSLLPEPVAQAWHLAFDHGLARATRAHTVLADALSALASANVVPVCLKGPVLAEECYPHPATRPMSDLDLLVRDDQRPAAERALRGVGFRPDPAGQHFLPGDEPRDGPLAVGVELHTDLLTGQFGNRKLARLRVAELHQRAMPISMDGVRCLALDPADTLIFLGAHMTVHHGVIALIWVTDLAYFVHSRGDQVDWEQLALRAERCGARRAVGWPLRLARDLLQVPVPSAVLGRLGAVAQPPRALRRFVSPEALFLPRGQPLGDADVVARSLFLDHLGDRFRYFAEIARGAASQQGPASLLQLGWRFLRAGWRLLCAAGR